MAAAVQAIRDFHADGLALPAKRPAKDTYDRGDLAAAAEKLGVSAETARQARQFADPAAGYTGAELDDLCRLVLEVQPGQDDSLAVFGKTHVIRLLTVRPKRTRAALQRRAVELGWSSKRLAAEVAARFGARRGGGRRRSAPADPLLLLGQAERLCEEWRRWLRLVDPGGAGPATRRGPRRITLAYLPDDLSEKLRAAGKALAKVQTAVSCEMGRMRPMRPDRKTRLALDGGRD